MTKIYKTTAKKLFNGGKDIQLYPCKANINSPWIHSTTINKTMREFVYYNCNYEMGYYPSCYVE